MTKILILTAMMPKRLEKGDTIAVAFPAYALSDGEKEIEHAVHWIKQKGYRAIVGDNVDSKHYLFSADERGRIEELQYFLDNDDIKAIWMGRGGYGMTQIIDKLDFSIFKKRPKWLIGFSDITALLAHVYARYDIQSIHGPVLKTMCSDTALFDENVFRFMSNQGVQYRLGSHPYNKMGKVSAPIIGGNLSMLLAIHGTLSDYDYTDKILLIEDTYEKIHHIDRMMGTLYRSGKLSRVKAIVAGDFQLSEEKEYKDFGAYPYDVIKKYGGLLDIPMAFEINVGHGKQNLPLMIGGETVLIIDKENVHIKQGM